MTYFLRDNHWPAPAPALARPTFDLEELYLLARRSFEKSLSKSMGMYKRPGSVPRLRIDSENQAIYRDSRTGKLSCNLTRQEWNIFRIMLQQKVRSAAHLVELMGNNTSANAIVAAVHRLNIKMRDKLDINERLISHYCIRPKFNLANPFGDE